MNAALKNSLQPLHIGIAGPIDLAPLSARLSKREIPPTYSFPLIGQLAEHLVQRGNHVSVFAGSTQISEVQKFAAHNLSIYICPLRPRRAAYDLYARERRFLCRVMSESGCHLIHAHWTYEFAAAALDSRLPCLITAHDSPLAIIRHFVLTRYFPYWTARAVLGAMVMLRAKRMTTVSPYCKHHIESMLRPSMAMAVVPNGVSREMIKLGRVRLDGDPIPLPLVLATVLEGFQERKNPKAVLRAFAEIRNVFPDATLRMFGSGYEKSGLAAAWSRKRGLSSGVQFMGKFSHNALIENLYKSVHILVHPAKEESFGMAPLEAMALGIPVVGGKKSGGVPYVLAGGKAGKLVDVHRPGEIARAVVDLAQKPGSMTKFAEAGWQRAAACFTLEGMVDAYLTEYAAIVEENPLTKNVF